MSSADVLKELFDLLEIYAPAWFTEDQRLRIVRTLGSAPEPVLDVLEASLESSDSPRTSPPCRKQLRSGARHRLSVVPACNSGNPTGGTLR